MPENLKIFVFNNYGGRIFERVKTPAQIINSHEMDFKNLTQALGKTYCLLGQGSNCNITEIQVDNLQTKKFWDDYNELF